MVNAYYGNNSWHIDKMKKIDNFGGEYIENVMSKYFTMYIEQMKQRSNLFYDQDKDDYCRSGKKTVANTFLPLVVKI